MDWIVGIESPDDGEVNFVVGPFSAQEAAQYKADFLAAHPGYDESFIFATELTSPDDDAPARFFD